MSIVDEFENTSWKDLPESEEKGYDKKKQLLKKQLAYYNKFKNKIRDYHVNFLIKDGYIHLPEYGTHINAKDKVGIKYALDVLDTLHNNNIYHGDIFYTSGLNNEQKLVGINHGNILVKDGIYKLIDFGPTEEIEKRNDEQLLKDEKKLLERYRRQQSNPAITEQHNLKLVKARKRRERKRRPLTPISPNKSQKNNEEDSPNHPPRISRMTYDGSLRIGSLFDGGKRRRRTKKKRRRKRKSTKKKRRRKRKSTKKKRRRRR